MGENHGLGLLVLCVVLICFSTTLVIARFYVRMCMLKNLGPDDWVALIALILLITMSSIEIQETVYASGRHMIDVPPENLRKFFSLLPSMQLVMFAASFVTRMSILLFLRRLLNSYRPLWAGIAVMVAYFLAFFFAFLFQCNPIKALWNRTIANKCFSSTDEALVMYIHAGFGVFLDFALLITPIVLLWKRLMFRKMKFRMLAVFSVGTFACAAGITRLAIITTIDMGSDITWHITKAAIWTNLECHIGLMVGCFPAIHPIFRLLRKKLTGQSTTKENNYSKSTPTVGGTGGNVGSKYGWGRSHNAKGRADLELYSIQTKVGGRGSGGNDSQEAIVTGGGIYKHVDVDVDVRVDDRISEAETEAEGASSVKSVLGEGGVDKGRGREERH